MSAADPIARWRYRRRTGTERPIPPVALRARVGTVSIEPFVTADAGYVNQALAAAGRRLDGLGSVLDFGCGCGRTLVPLAEQAPPGTALHGCDVDADAIAWLRQHHPGLRLEVNRFDPPLPYDPGAFDFVSSISVFTHLDEESQFAWLRELRRVLRPGGLAALTVHGERSFDRFSRGEDVGAIRSAADRISAHGSLAENGFIYEAAEPSRWNALRYGNGSGSWGIAFHSKPYVEERWSEVFSSVRMLDGPSQDVVLVEP
jgi:SAM-dependent methyltransferase